MGNKKHNVHGVEVAKTLTNGYQVAQKGYTVAVPASTGKFKPQAPSGGSNAIRPSSAASNNASAKSKR